MKYYENYLLKKGFSVNYFKANEQQAYIRFWIKQLHGLAFAYKAIVDAVDDWF